MPFINITATQPLAAEQKQQLIQRTSDAVIEALSTALPSVRIMLHELPAGHYYCGGKFDTAAILYDIDMIEGRTEEAKANLIKRLSQVAHEATGVPIDEVRTRLSDFPKENIGMAGGITAKQAGR
ncbi:MAG TPA: tautomerase family protein, partial [Pusillimonas sp.]|uniref:tautomerase family protein n=1 Tax=unclassified Pusillimonas TaxID=2640016 RepID=UPI00262ABA98|nr:MULTISPECIES: tautomerase family protein [unclassified Pusillimonas]HLU20650.1 tautomerase family protein [Pusillimonas sp.]